ncbi:MAG TPA: TlpA family protein disulfide reductase [Firmicutes bacterium]|jgi:cytochrome c biogenesis protein CcmG/thiol:disulfide interchange protein DsbE|nr:TlpA family protein disulfide reductase [Bacillota bacterium]
MTKEGRKKLLYPFIFFIIIGLGLVLGDKQEEAKVGAVAPGFRLEGIAGERIDLKKISRQNQLTLVNFWATWCPPCRAEIPELNRVYRVYRAKGLEILAVNIWDDSTREQLRAFTNATGIEFPVLLDVDDSTATKYQIRAVPTTVFIDQKGRIREVYVGALTYGQIQTRFERYLANQ